MARPLTPRPPRARRLAAATLCLALVGVLGFAQMRRPRLLSDGQVNRIKQQEMRPADDHLRFRFTDDVLRQFPQTQPDLDVRDFRRLSPMEQALTLLRRGTRAERESVVVRGDPAALRAWREDVQPVVLRGCATSNCHGPRDPALAYGFYLRPKPKTANEHYTNFYALTSYDRRAEDREDELFKRDRERMIDRQRPSDSLLLQYALPPEVADVPHPPVPGQGYRGAFRGEDDDRYQMVGRWIESLKPMMAGYDVDFEPEGRLPEPPDQP